MNKLEMIKKVVDEGAMKVRIDGRKVYLDGYTAGMLLAVCNALNEENRAKFLALPLMKMCDIGWKLVK